MRRTRSIHTSVLPLVIATMLMALGLLLMHQGGSDTRVEPARAFLVAPTASPATLPADPLRAVLMGVGRPLALPEHPERPARLVLDAPDAAPAPPAPDAPDAAPHADRAHETTRTGGCAVYAGERLTAATLRALVAEWDWTPYGPETVARVFELESRRYVGAHNVCTHDHGLPQINQVHGGWCDLERARAVARYAIGCANRVYWDRGGGRAGISAWYAGEGWLWCRGENLACE